MVKKQKQVTKIDSNSKKTEIYIPSDPRERQSLDRIYALLLESFQIDFTHYRHTTILRRMSRRMNINKKDNFLDYLKYLKKNSSEINLLYDDLLLSFTEFFRDKSIYETLKKKLFPNLIVGKSVRTPIRIWVPGCSTGEEVYSLAICLYEFLEETKSKIPIQFFGTDLMERHVNKARLGLYPDKIEKDISKNRLKKFFDKTPDGYKVIKHIREMCVFAVQDIIQDPPFPNIDLISCRNVLIYFDENFQEKTIPLFHFSLKPDGFLLLGTSETMGRFPQYFDIIDNKLNLYSKRNTETRPEYSFPINNKNSKLKKVAKTMPSSIKNKTNNSEITNQINDILVETYSPPGVLIDNNLQIIQFIGHTFPYLRPESGTASLKLTKMADTSLMPDIYVIYEEAKKKKQKITRKNIIFKQNEVSKTINVSIIPIPDQNSKEMNFLILFEETVNIEDKTSFNSLDNKDTNEVSALKGELLSTKESLQLIVEEKDEINQALWASNEEVLSTNEELQSVNEEMEAAKEELESGNEELISLNEELQLKNVELKENENNLRTLFNSMTDIVFEMDYDGKYISIAPTSPDLMFKPADNTVGKTLHDIFPKQEADMFLQFVRNCLDTNQTNTIEYPLTIDNNTIWFEGKATPKSKNSVLYIARNITQNKLAIDALKESEEWFSAISEQSVEGITVANPSGGYVFVNPSFCRMMGYTREEILRMTVFDMKKDKTDKAKEGFKESKSKQEGAVVEVELQRKDGSTFISEVVGKPIIIANEKLVLGTVKDITERKQAEEEKNKLETQLRHSQKMETIGTLAGGIAHDFNNILAPIMGYTEMALFKLNESEPLYSDLQNVLKGTHRAKDLVEQILLFSKQSEKERQPVSLQSQINEALKLLRPSIPTTIEINYDIDNTCPLIMADTTQIHQVIVNLCTNAWQAMEKKGGLINIELKLKDIDANFTKLHPELIESKYACLSITDTGSGMDTQTIDRIFEPFFTTKEIDKGTGLGLSVVHGIIKSHKGGIIVYSEPDKGSTIHVYLPIIKSDDMLVRNKIHKIIGGSEHIMIVDDEPLVLEMVDTMLSKFGYKTSTFTNALDAIKAFKRAPDDFDLLLSDLTMPRMTGLELANYLKKNDIALPVIIMTGFGDNITNSSQTNNNIKKTIGKPIIIKELTDTIREVLK